MLTLDFPGSRTLIDAIDAAVAKPTTHELTDSLRQSLCRLIREQAVRLPECVFEANPEHYARRELYRSEDHGYCVVAMTWGPGQGTPIHDHDGMWCVEGVWNGAPHAIVACGASRASGTARWRSCSTNCWSTMRNATASRQSARSRPAPAPPAA